MIKVIMGIGMPGSGKTTVLKAFAEKNQYVYICPDDIRLEITGDTKDQSKNKEVWARAYSLVGERLSEGKTVVFDATFAAEQDRTRFIDFARKNGAQKIQGVYMDIPLEVAKERNIKRERTVPEHALDRMSENLKNAPPSIKNGFDSIFTFDEFQKLEDVEKMRSGEIINKEFKSR